MPPTSRYELFLSSLIMPGAHARAGRARPRVLLREVVFAPVVELERVALGELLALVLSGRLAVEQPPRGVEAGRAGAEDRIGLCHGDYSSPSRRICPGRSFSGMTTSTSAGWLFRLFSSCSAAFSSADGLHAIAFGAERLGEREVVPLRQDVEGVELVLRAGQERRHVDVDLLDRIDARCSSRR